MDQCPSSKVRNTTGRCVDASGPIGRRVLRTSPVLSRTEIVKQLPKGPAAAAWERRLYARVYGAEHPGTAFHDYSDRANEALRYVLESRILGPEARVLTPDLAHRLVPEVGGSRDVITWAMHRGEEADIPYKSSWQTLSHYLIKVTLVRPKTARALAKFGGSHAYRPGALYWYNHTTKALGIVDDALWLIGEDPTRAHAVFAWVRLPQ